ncbi:hypothetical protein LTR02_002570 [Friedmanniomyces endolithicus]|uniref:Mitochondrial zinc maintenance protein 1, mitochondrial n=1 Tax=Rachicladosporium monterosium TaxID=1507873 RepID=A0ABR0LGQ5_9PEZI|nr:hypothetical protein LTR94_007830 [Friedmanniomyces endolithicus]KAK5148495.1 hypothetical protein LTR32_000222 [Rachicladosporium monterosium]KAK0793108.1 hypothetical protein LTR59_008277 [Friedmanniomyces endolithicus]KAK0806141.1 hypothetical protein LTR75_007106 [Friedmanniomyces endolithicus]KAK0871694.1 hypothetical protein LTS02_001758 [Friedmanniomyces endolithicus]
MPPSPLPPPQAILHAYRHLLQHALRACRHAKPARFTVRDRLRRAFRTSSSQEYDAGRVERTLEFLGSAAEFKGVEYRLSRTLAHVWWERERLGRMTGRPDVFPLRRRAYEEFDRTLERLNESMGLCIK